jgi:hypothetical protein
MEPKPTQRRSSTGRSTVIDNCITTLTELLNNNCNLEDISGMVINNTLPGEFRSIAWRVFLNVLPRKESPGEWVKATQANREKFDQLSKDKEIVEFTKVIRNEVSLDTISNKEITECFNMAQNELGKLSANSDFFKSQIVAETLLRLYIIWRKNNEDFSAPNPSSALIPFYILAEVIYALYPSILHFNSEITEIKINDDISPKVLFYFLNSEEYFDADVYSIFTTIINNSQIKEILKNYNNVPITDSETIKKIIENDEFLSLPLETEVEESKKVIAGLNRFEKMSYFYLKVANKNLLKFLHTLSPYSIEITFSIWVVSLLTKSIPFDQLTYFWDNIFLNSPEDFRFIDFICTALLSNLGSELQAGKDIDLLGKYPESHLHLKEIIKKALKVQDKVADAFH